VWCDIPKATIVMKINSGIRGGSIALADFIRRASEGRSAFITPESQSPLIQVSIFGASTQWSLQKPANGPMRRPSC
jgi:hypothetical protein